MLTGGTDVHLVLVDLRDSELDGKQAEDRLHVDRHHGQPQRGAVRPAAADGHLRPADRHPGAGHPRLRRRRTSPRSPTSSPRRCGPTLDDAAPAPPCGPGSTGLAAKRPALPRRSKGPDSDRRIRPTRAPRVPTCRTTRTSSGATRSRRSSYDVVIVGGGGHGLATAHYLAKNHGITNVAVLEKGWLAGGNMARNTTLIRSNYLWDESAGIYEHSLKLWEGLEEDLGLPDPVQPARRAQPRAHACRTSGTACAGSRPTSSTASTPNGSTPDEVKELCPIVNISTDIRYPVLGATYQPRAGIAKHDYVAWGFARARRRGGRRPDPGLRGHRLRHATATGSPACAPPGATSPPGRSRCARPGTPRCWPTCSGIQLPLQSHPLQALVSELLEPVHPTVVMSNAVHVYVSQAHKGELVMGAGVDAYNGYGQRGAFHIIERQMAAAVELFPVFARAHLLRTWGGIVDVTPDASPDRRAARPSTNLYLNCGWGTGGFKATPGHRLVLRRTPSPTASRTRCIAPFTLDRFVTGALVDEHGAAAVRPLTAPSRSDHAAHRLPVVRAPRGGRVPLRRPGPRRPTPPTRPRCPTSEWAHYVFFRDNPKGPFAERWSHAAGCRRWFNAVRDTATHQFLAVYRLGEPKPVTA